MSRRVDDNRSETRRAEELMLRAVGLTDDTYPHPNPRVGAVVLSPDGTVVAERAHAGPGQPHAEVLALTDAGGRAGGGTLVVTLEPCSHHGRTPPCVDAILNANVATVIIGVEDPDLRVSGSGVSQLREAPSRWRPQSMGRRQQPTGRRNGSPEKKPGQTLIVSERAATPS